MWVWGWGGGGGRNSSFKSQQDEFSITKKFVPRDTRMLSLVYIKWCKETSAGGIHAPKSISFAYAPNNTSVISPKRVHMTWTCTLIRKQGNKRVSTHTFPHTINHTHMHIQTTRQYGRAHYIRIRRIKVRQDPRKHQTPSNEIQNSGHGLYPIEMRLEKVQCSQLEFITGGMSTRTHVHTHTHTQKEQETAQKSVCSLIHSKSDKSPLTCRG